MPAANSEEILPFENIAVTDTYRLTFDQIDQIIVNNIRSATEENSDVWTCPDYNKREYIHSFFQYPARMIPAVQRKLIEIITTANPCIQNMVDPFMGSATTLVACMESGLNCYGQDINPLAVLIGKARTGPYFTNGLKIKWEKLERRINDDESTIVEVSFKGIDKWFKEEVQVQLSKIVRGIRKESSPLARRFFWVVLAETIRVSSNDRTSTYKLHIRKQEEINKRTFSAISVFKLRMDKALNDFDAHAELLSEKAKLSKRAYVSDIDIRLSDSKEKIYSPNREAFYDLLVTSPPYGDNKTTVTYGQNSYLPLQWIDLSDIDSKATNDYLKSTSEIDTRSLGGTLKKEVNGILEELFLSSPLLRETYERIKAKSPKSVTKVANFFLDLSKTVDNIFDVMKPNSYQIWTIGNRNVAKIEIPNDEILTELIESKGGLLLTQVEREIINKRMGKKNKDTCLMNTEDILIFRKVG